MKNAFTDLLLFLSFLLTIVSLFVGLAASSASAGATVQVITPLDSTNVTQQETNFGDLIADAVRQAGGADAAFVPADEITATVIPAGSLAITRIVDALRYNEDPTDTVMILSLTGAQLKLIAERSVSRLPQPFDGFLQISGLTIHYDLSQPAGQRVTQVMVDGASVDLQKSYRVATTHSIADGSFGYFSIWTPAAIVTNTRTTIASALATYLLAQRTLNVTLQNRIVP
jgi:2',3'-cyclic-nucleotide 2'-phosphodiesterase (5'-nucleotidase family)